jgi:hypothetical protein
MASVSIGACSTALATDVEGFAECIDPARLGFRMPVGALPDADSDFVVRFVVMFSILPRHASQSNENLTKTLDRLDKIFNACLESTAEFPPPHKLHACHICVYQSPVSRAADLL